MFTPDCVGQQFDHQLPKRVVTTRSNFVQEPGKAQLIVAKQRNGPTDDVDMTFLRECTKFVPYSPVMSGETEPGF